MRGTYMKCDPHFLYLTTLKHEKCGINSTKITKFVELIPQISLNLRNNILIAYS